MELNEDNITSRDSINADAWLPTLCNLEDLYLAYSGQIKKLTNASKIAAWTELRSFPVIPNLSPKGFQAYIGRNNFRYCSKNISNHSRLIIALCLFQIQK